MGAVAVGWASEMESGSVEDGSRREEGGLGCHAGGGQRVFDEESVSEMPESQSNQVSGMRER